MDLARSSGNNLKHRILIFITTTPSFWSINLFTKYLNMDLVHCFWITLCISMIRHHHYTHLASHPIEVLQTYLTLIIFSSMMCLLEHFINTCDLHTTLDTVIQLCIVYPSPCTQRNDTNISSLSRYWDNITDNDFKISPQM